MGKVRAAWIADRGRMEIVEGGKLTDDELLELIVTEQALADKRYVPFRNAHGTVMHENIIETKTDTFHFVVDTAPSLQISVNREKAGFVATTFLSPRLIAPSTRPAFVTLSNELDARNLVPGRFAVIDRDLFYQAIIPVAFFPILRDDSGARDEARKVLFTQGAGIFWSIAIAVDGLSRKGWSSDDALRFVDELYTRGFIYDSDWL